ncbi:MULTISPECIES: GNAT family N-acetyltransferase [unclassified Marinobacter]|jgi:ribosomal protein S18 acetylase RimI-like enzyme|uniref:GNAT family N-acetyltransferase n=1 Tax=unclassified Marinobacter TaxID=83889 RepID=UPI00200C852B|nr:MULTISPECIES: GNAT family N-acetyltransferase [unclassified Marinobacter]MCL1485973.1 GNAT family N-acetyltransferase [Marinobacter sp.]UQG55936.1 GNAT family N-acetyltransferase [Marinobacter sp. M4C]UQG64741.1 GNAT family N-acetyltransferase [Marinobacter sp. M2C]UQG69019.1 GNAT family N-acetyltransferase [Marinobacter sp. M1C]
MEIRRAVAKDIDALLVLNNQIGLYHYEHAPHAFVEPSAADRDFFLNALNDGARLFLLAEIKDEVVGFITAVITQNETVPFLVRSPICRIGTIVVDESKRVKGVGTKLMVACQNWAIDLGVEQIRLEVMSFNEVAQKFYENLGFNIQSHIMSKQFG